MTDVHRPTSLIAALDALSDPERRPVPVAGCTDVMVVDAAEDRRHAAVMDVMRIPELQGISLEAETLSIGAATTFAQLGRHLLVHEHVPVLREVAMTVGGWQIQNRATVGGNIANASPAGDSLPAWLALDASVEIASSEGVRTVPYVDLHVGYRRTALAPGELIVRVRVPLPAPGVHHHFRKVGTRRAQAISKVVVVSAVRLDGGVMRDVRVAAGSVAPVPLRLTAVEQALEGQVPAERIAERAGTLARESVTPIDDVRSTARYRSFVLGRIVRRVVLDLA